MSHHILWVDSKVGIANGERNLMCPMGILILYKLLKKKKQRTEVT